MIRESERHTASGLLMLAIFLIILIVSALGIVRAVRAQDPFGIGAFVLVLVLDIIASTGFFTVAPNEGQVLQLFGAYRGTVRENGLRWANPFFSKRRLSLRVRNFESGKLKVNDTDGNPIEIAAVVVWRVIDTAEAVFQVDEYDNYVKVQSEAAVRNLATRYPYDSHDEERVSLRGSTADVAHDLKREIQERLAKAGVEVIEARISTRAVRLCGSTRTDFMFDRSIMTPPSQTALPAMLCPTPRTDARRSLSLAKFTAWITSAAPAHRTISAGRRSIMAFQMRRVSS